MNDGAANEEYVYRINMGGKLITSPVKWSSLVSAVKDFSQENQNFFIKGIDSIGKTALIYAACERHTAIVELLTARGADPNSLSREGPLL